MMMISTASYSQVVYTDIQDTTIYIGDTLYIDINDDELDDFFFTCYNLNTKILSNYAYVVYLNENRVAASQPWEGAWGWYVTEFEGNEIIDADLFPSDMAYSTLLYHTGITSEIFGYWGGAIDSFIGIRLLDGCYYYGWIQADVSLGADWITIKSYAYNSNPYDPITTPTLTTIRETSNNHDFNLYPNPTNDKIFINTKSINTDVKVSIINLEGIVVSSQVICTGNALDISNLKAGIYFLKLESEDVILTEKIIKL
jgi:hypothetical protein